MAGGKRLTHILLPTPPNFPRCFRSDYETPEKEKAEEPTDRPTERNVELERAAKISTALHEESVSPYLTPAFPRH